MLLICCRNGVKVLKPITMFSPVADSDQLWPAQLHLWGTGQWWSWAGQNRAEQGIAGKQACSLWEQSAHPPARSAMGRSCSGTLNSLVARFPTGQCPGWSNSFLIWHPAIVLVTTFNVKLWPDTIQQARDSHWKQVCPRLLLCTFIFISTTSAPTRVAKGRVRGRRVTQVIVGGGTRATKGSHDMFHYW